MSHHIYQTEGIILGSRNVGESNKLFFLLTKDLGFVPAAAQGIRNIRSKLRYSLQDFGYVKVDMVRGKDIWRITNAEGINGYHRILQDKDNTILIARIFSLLRRLLHGEEENKELFNILTQIMRFVDTHNLSREDLTNLEIVANLKILHCLGYVDEDEEFRTFIMMPPSKEILAYVNGVKKRAITSINRGLKESQL